MGDCRLPDRQSRPPPQQTHWPARLPRQATASITIENSRKPRAPCMPTRSRKKDKANEFSLIPERKLLELYSWTVRCRLLGELLEGVHRSASPLDLEAASVAVCLDLKNGDRVFTTGQEFLPAYVRARNLAGAMQVLREPAASVAVRLSEALEAARAFKQAKTDHLVAVFCAGAEGRSQAWKKALRVADAETLPVIFVRILESGSEISGHAEHGFPAIPADGHDVVAIYRVASESFAHARMGHGATLIECIPWALAGEDGNDAVLNLERFLTPRGIATASTKAGVKAGFARVLREWSQPGKGRKATRQRSR